MKWKKMTYLFLKTKFYPSPTGFNSIKWYHHSSMKPPREIATRILEAYDKINALRGYKFSRKIKEVISREKGTCRGLLMKRSRFTDSQIGICQGEWENGQDIWGHVSSISISNPGICIDKCTYRRYISYVDWEVSDSPTMSWAKFWLRFTRRGNRRSS